MHEQKQHPGRSTLTAEHRGPVGDAHAAVGKRTRVAAAEQDHSGAMHPAAAARHSGLQPATAGQLVTPRSLGITPSPEVEASYSTKLCLRGGLCLEQTATVSVANVHGNVNVSISSRGLSIGNSEVHLDLEKPGAVRGKHMHVSGAGAVVRSSGAHHSELRMKDGYLGVEYTAFWTITSPYHPWRAELKLSTFIGVLPPPPKQPPWWEELPVVGALGALLEQAVKWLSDATGFLEETSPEWAPLVLVAAA